MHTNKLEAGDLNGQYNRLWKKSYKKLLRCTQTENSIGQLLWKGTNYNMEIITQKDMTNICPEPNI